MAQAECALTASLMVRMNPLDRRLGKMAGERQAGLEITSVPGITFPV